MSAVSRNLGNPGGLASPPAVRARTPGWRDPRLWVGVAIVAVSVVVGARLFAAADDSVPVWAVAADMGAGDLVGADDLTVQRVRFADADDLDRYYRADEELPADLRLVRGVGDGELLPRAATGAGEGAEHMHLSIEVAPGRVPTSVAAGSVVDVFVLGPPAGDRGTGPDSFGPALEEVTVVDAPTPAEGFGATPGVRQLVLAVPEGGVEEFYRLVSRYDDPRLSVVRRPS